MSSPYVSTLTLDRDRMKQNDTLPVLIFWVSDTNGPIDLTGVTTITLIMKGNASATLVTGSCTAVDGNHGEGQYVWTGTNTATPDVYQVEVELTSLSGKQTVPSAYTANPTITIDQQLDPPTG